MGTLVLQLTALSLSIAITFSIALNMLGWPISKSNTISILWEAICFSIFACLVDFWMRRTFEFGMSKRFLVLLTLCAVYAIGYWVYFSVLMAV